jgi:hypothetical protein
LFSCDGVFFSVRCFCWLLLQIRWASSGTAHKSSSKPTNSHKSTKAPIWCVLYTYKRKAEGVSL